MKRPDMSLWGIMIANLVSRYLARNRPRAEFIIRETFKGYRIAKIRKDFGTTKKKAA